MTVLELYRLLSEPENRYSHVYTCVEELENTFVRREILGVIGLDFGLVLVTAYDIDNTETFLSKPCGE